MNRYFFCGLVFVLACLAITVRATTSFNTSHVPLQVSSFGSMSLNAGHDSPMWLDLQGPGVYVPVSGFVSHLLKGVSFSGAATSALTPNYGYGGNYLVEWSATLMDTEAHDVMEGAILLNDVAQGLCKQAAEGDHTNLPYQVSGQCVLEISNGTTVKFALENETNNGDIYLHHVFVSITRI